MTPEHLNLTIVQDNATVGDIDGNTQMVLDHLAREKDADLVIFPECFLTGYPLGDLVTRPGFIASVERGIDNIRKAVAKTGGAAVLVGAPMAGANLPYNAAFLIEPSGAMRVVRKRELPNNDVFDERRTFSMSDERPTPLSFRGFNLGIQICEDMWHADVSRGLADELADVLVVLNGSPYQHGKQDTRTKVARARVKATGLPLIYANLVGGQDELVFDGASFVMNAEGGHIGAAAFNPDVIHLRMTRHAEEGVKLSFENDFKMKDYPEDTIAADYNACVLGLQDYVKKTGTPHVVVGVSGGLDSALVLAMAVDALGPKRVIGIMMPSEYTGDESLGLADDLMDRLGVHKQVLPIGGMFDAVRGATLDSFAEMGVKLGRTSGPSTTQENYQARLRGLTLMGVTNALGGIVLSTGNKSEMSVGYATLYGDMNGGFNPLKSVYKSDAFRMAEWRNTTTELAQGPVIANPIPTGIITRPPSAELAEGQTDQASLGDYDILDAVLYALIEQKADAPMAARIITAKFGKDDVWKRSGGYSPEPYAEKIAKLVRGAQYKRDQSCPGVKLNLTDFGLGWRMPIAGRYTL